MHSAGVECTSRIKPLTYCCAAHTHWGAKTAGNAQPKWTARKGALRWQYIHRSPGAKHVPFSFLAKRKEHRSWRDTWQSFILLPCCDSKDQKQSVARSVWYIKGSPGKKGKFSPDLPTFMLMEVWWWSFVVPQNISGASQQNGVTAFSLTTEIDGDWGQLKTNHEMAQFNSSGVNDGSGSPEIPANCCQL